MSDNEKINWNITGQNSERRIFKIPIGKLSKKEIKKYNDRKRNV